MLQLLSPEPVNETLGDPCTRTSESRQQSSDLAAPRGDCARPSASSHVLAVRWVSPASDRVGERAVECPLSGSADRRHVRTPERQRLLGDLRRPAQRRREGDAPGQIQVLGQEQRRVQAAAGAQQHRRQEEPHQEQGEGRGDAAEGERAQGGKRAPGGQDPDAVQGARGAQGAVSGAREERAGRWRRTWGRAGSSGRWRG